MKQDNTFGERLKEELLSRGWGFKQFAEKLLLRGIYVAEEELARLCDGEVQPLPEQERAIEQVLNLPPGSLRKASIASDDFRYRIFLQEFQQFSGLPYNTVEAWELVKPKLSRHLSRDALKDHIHLILDGLRASGGYQAKGECGQCGTLIYGPKCLKCGMSYGPES